MEPLTLTFDDGPDPAWTPRLLDVLARAGARATFFTIAPRAAAHPDLVARILADGHVIGLHCNEHVRHSSHEVEWIRRDTARALALLDTVGVRPTLWRTPWGDTTPGSGEVARENRLRIVHWTVDTHDWRGDWAEDMFTATKRKLCSGAIVLAHDGIGPGARRGGADQTVAYTALVAAHARRVGLELGALT